MDQRGVHNEMIVDIGRAFQSGTEAGRPRMKEGGRKFEPCHAVRSDKKTRLVPSTAQYRSPLHLCPHLKENRLTMTTTFLISSRTWLVSRSTAANKLKTYKVTETIKDNRPIEPVTRLMTTAPIGPRSRDCHLWRGHVTNAISKLAMVTYWSIWNQFEPAYSGGRHMQWIFNRLPFILVTGPLVHWT